MRKLYRITLLISLLITGRAWAQTMDCEQTIALATEEFNAGHFYSVPEILSECLNTFSREQKQRAFLLLTQTYLLLDDPVGARRSYLEVLSANPEFVPDEQLHAIDIVYLSKRFTATPRFSWSMSAGSNVSLMRVILDRDMAQDVSEKYSLRPGYHFGAGGEYSYNDHIRLRMELNFLQSAYEGQSVGRFEHDFVTIVDRQSWINIPLYVCYSDNSGRYRPYGYAGIAVSGMLKDWGTITLRKVEGIGEEMDFLEVQSSDFDFTERRNRLNQSLIFGGGVRYKIGLDFVFAELRYSAGMKNIVNPDYSYGNHGFDRRSPEWIQSSSPGFEYGYVDDYMRLDNLAVTIGFVRPLYKPRELKRARTKSVLRRMKRS